MAHEATHYLTIRLFGKLGHTVLEELVADWVGLGAAFGSYRPELARQFMRVENQNRVRLGGRLANYRPSDLPEQAFAALAQAVKLADGRFVAAEELERVALACGLCRQPALITTAQGPVLVVVAEGAAPPQELRTRLAWELNRHLGGRALPPILVDPQRTAWTPENGLLSPSLKPRKQAIAEHYRRLLSTVSSTPEGVAEAATEEGLRLKAFHLVSTLDVTRLAQRLGVSGNEEAPLPQSLGEAAAQLDGYVASKWVVERMAELLHRHCQGKLPLLVSRPGLLLWSPSGFAPLWFPALLASCLKLGLLPSADPAVFPAEPVTTETSARGLEPLPVDYVGELCSRLTSALLGSVSRKAAVSSASIS